ncbi:MAG: LacI family DNA-binding transcriptional regulator [Armatimonadetes bacterium]|nr:LacI family DNA-binding transcriptional regulator [Armatimonadota bacterium]
MRVTIVDIARKTGLSQATVSRALNPEQASMVSPATRELVQSVAQEIGYRPNVIGRALVGGRTGIINYLTDDPFAPYYSSVAQHVAHMAAGRGYSMVLDCTYNPQNADSDEPIRRSEFLYGVDGIIAIDIAVEQNNYADEFIKLNIPVVGMGQLFPRNVDSVAVDLYDASRQIMQHLYDQGAREVIMILQDKALRINDLRGQGYAEFCEEHGMEPDFIYTRGDLRESARRAMHAYHGKNRKLPDAFFCFNDDTAIGCYRGLVDGGFRVPTDVLIAGCDGIKEMEYHRTSLTTFALPIAEMVSQSWNLLERRMAGYKGEPEKILLKGHLLARDSTNRE